MTRTINTRIRAQRGVSMLDGLVGMAVLSFGVLSVGSLQARLLTAGTDAQTRLQAVRQADRLVSLALVDPAQGACYQVPPAPGSTCTDADALAAAATWRQETLDALHAPTTAATASAIYDGTRFVVTLQWTGKQHDAHQLTAVTDVRP